MEFVCKMEDLFHSMRQIFHSILEPFHIPYHFFLPLHTIACPGQWPEEAACEFAAKVESILSSVIVALGSVMHAALMQFDYFKISVSARNSSTHLHVIKLRYTGYCR